MKARRVIVRCEQGEIRRVTRGKRPMVELELAAEDRLVSMEFFKREGYGDRKTDDWKWTAYIERTVEVAR